MSKASKTRLVVLASGKGTNLQAVLDACASGGLSAEVVAVFSDRASAFALERARRAGVPAFLVPPTKGEGRRFYDSDLADRVAAYEPDWVLLLGWMRLLSGVFTSRFADRTVNLHPALPGAYPGLDAIARAFASAQDGGERESGVMCHLVPDEGVDSGPVLGLARVPILPGDRLSDFEERMHAAERSLVLSTLNGLLRDGVVQTT